MKITPTRLPEVLLLQPDVFRDERGFFLETYNHARYISAGISETFVQDNHSRSVKGTLRGLHAQLRHAQAKLVRVGRGAVLDVAVDIRSGSATAGQWVGVELTADSFEQLYIPAGFAHGFYALTDEVEVIYKCSAPYDPADEVCLRWNDPQLGIQWPDKTPILSEKDRNGLTFRQLQDRLAAVSTASKGQ